MKGFAVPGAGTGPRCFLDFYKQKTEAAEEGAEAKIQWLSGRGKSLARDPFGGTDKQGQLKAEGGHGNPEKSPPARQSHSRPEATAAHTWRDLKSVALA